MSPEDGAGDATPMSLATAYQQVAMRLSMLRPDQILPTPVDARHAALTALLVSDLVSRPEVVTRFQALESTGEFDSRVVFELPVLARAVLYASSQAAIDCVLPVSSKVCEPAMEVRDRMMLACASRLDRIPEAVRRFDGLRGGSSPADLVRDLRILGDLYRDFGPFIGVEEVRADRDLAWRLAERIEDAGAGGPNDDRAAWRARLRRAWSLLVPAYEDVRRAGRFLFRTNDDDGRFPELPLAPRFEKPVGSLIPPPMAVHAVARPTLPVDAGMGPIPAYESDPFANLSANGERTAPRGLSVTPPPASAPYEVESGDLLPHEAAALDALQRAIDVASSTPPLRVVQGRADSSRTDAGFESDEEATASIGLVLEEVTISEEDDSGGEDEDEKHARRDSAAFPRTSTVLRVLEGAPPTHQREHERYRAELSVTLVSRSNFYIGVTDNLSEGGLFIATQELHPRGTPVEMMVVLPGQDAPLAIGGEVRWVREFAESSSEPPGLGIRFVDLSDRAARAIREFLLQRPPLVYDD